MTERNTKEQLMQDSEYLKLVKFTFDNTRDSLKGGLRVRDGYFFPHKFYGPNFRIALNLETNEIIFKIENPTGIRVSSMTYHIKEGQIVTKTGYAEGQGLNDHQRTYFTNDINEVSGKIDINTFVKPPIEVDLAEMTIISEVITNPQAKAELLYELPQFQL
jgi:hypothetical protein